MWENLRQRNAYAYLNPLGAYGLILATNDINSFHCEKEYY